MRYHRGPANVSPVTCGRHENVTARVEEHEVRGGTGRHGARQVHRPVRQHAERGVGRAAAGRPPGSSWSGSRGTAQPRTAATAHAPDAFIRGAVGSRRRAHRARPKGSTAVHARWGRRIEEPSEGARRPTGTSRRRMPIAPLGSCPTSCEAPPLRSASATRRRASPPLGIPNDKMSGRWGATEMSRTGCLPNVPALTCGRQRERSDRRRSSGSAAS